MEKTTGCQQQEITPCSWPMGAGMRDLGLLENFSFERGPLSMLEDFVKPQTQSLVKWGGWGTCPLQSHSDTTLVTPTDWLQEKTRESVSRASIKSNGQKVGRKVRKPTASINKNFEQKNNGYKQLKSRGKTKWWFRKVATNDLHSWCSDTETRGFLPDFQI